DARPVGVAETPGTVLAGVERRVDREGKKEEDENSDQHCSNGGAHGFERDRASGPKYGVCHPACTMAVRHTGTLKTRKGLRKRNLCASMPAGVSPPANGGGRRLHFS